jgi:hypothetical protein
MYPLITPETVARPSDEKLNITILRAGVDELKPFVQIHATTQPSDRLLSMSINPTHETDLMISLAHIFLVDTKSVYPQRSTPTSRFSPV